MYSQLFDSGWNIISIIVQDAHMFSSHHDDGIVNEESIILFQIVSKKAFVYSEGYIIVHQLVSYKLYGELHCLACATS